MMFANNTLVIYQRIFRHLIHDAHEATVTQSETDRLIERSFQTEDSVNNRFNRFSLFSEHLTKAIKDFDNFPSESNEKSN